MKTILSVLILYLGSILLTISTALHSFAGMLFSIPQNPSNFNTVKGVVTVVNQKEPLTTTVKDLPKLKGTLRIAGKGIDIIAGDNGLSQRTLQSTLRLITTVSLPVLQANIHQLPLPQVNIVMFSTKDTYKAALKRAGISGKLISGLVSNSGGMTVGSDIWIPYYTAKGTSDLANVLAHELTHVVFNQNGIANKLPTWLNEGTAWWDGLTAQGKINPSLRNLEVTYLKNDVLQAAKNHTLLPLSADEQDIIRATYNVEFEDFLATNYLVEHYGQRNFADFLLKLKTKSLSSSFTSHFRTALKTYEDSVYRSLTT